MDGIGVNYTHAHMVYVRSMKGISKENSVGYAGAVFEVESDKLRGRGNGGGAETGAELFNVFITCLQ